MVWVFRNPIERFNRFGRHVQSHERDVASANRILGRGGDLTAAKQRIRDAFAMSQRGEVPENMPWTKPGAGGLDPISQEPVATSMILTTD